MSSYVGDEKKGGRAATPLIEKDAEDVKDRNQTTEQQTLGFSAFEKLLEGVGSDGKFQKFLIYGFMAPLAFIYGFPAGSFILILSTPNHVCYVPGMENFPNVTEMQWRNMTIPWEPGPDGQMRQSQCQMFNVSYRWNHTTKHLGTEEQDLLRAAEVVIDEDTTTDCQFGWSYDTDVWKATGVSRFDWVCDQKANVAHLFTLKMIGGAIGTLVFAILSDRFGRRPTFYASLLLCVIFGPAMAFAPNLTVFAIFDFLYALAFYTVYQMPFLIVMEITSEKLRSVTVISSFLTFFVAVCLLPLFSWLLADWRMMFFVYCLPMTIFFLYWRFVPESPRFLLSRNRIDEFKAVMGKIASANGRTGFAGEDFEELIAEAQREEKNKASATTFFKSFVLAKHLVLTCLVMSLANMFYVGINLNLHNMTGNTFVNFFLLSFFEIPGNIIGSLSSDYLGRRITAVILEIASAVSILISMAFISNKWGVAVSCGISKMFVGGVGLAVYKQIGELFPTSLRATAYGVTGIVGMASTVVVPSLMALGGSNAYIPYYFLCSLSVVGAVACTFLPETIGLPFPQTLPEATRIGRNQPYCSLIYKGNAHKLLEEPVKTERGGDGVTESHPLQSKY